MLSDDDLCTLLRRGESDRVERKESFAISKDKIAQAICAFANDLPGHKAPGVVFIGVHDDGRCVGLPITDELLLTLSAMRDNGALLPFPQMTVQKRSLDGCELAVVEVQPADNPPVRYKNQVWVRVGPRRARATAAEENILTEKRRWGNLPFDLHGVAGAGLRDLDQTYFRLEYLPSAVNPETLAKNHRDPVQQMRALRLLTPDDTPTVTGLLVTGIDLRYWLPGAYIQFVRWAGDAMTDDIQDEKTVTGTLGAQLRQIEQIITAHIMVAADLSSGREIRQPDYPLPAVQELLRNALIHRNYESSNAPVRVYWFSDRLEIISPGMPYGHVTRDNFGTPGRSDYRNPTIAEAMKNLGFAQRFGMGIQRARQALARNGNPAPEFRCEDGYVTAILRPRAGEAAP